MAYLFLSNTAYYEKCKMTIHTNLIYIYIYIYICKYIYIYIYSKVGDRNRGRPEGFLFNIYDIEV